MLLNPSRADCPKMPTTPDPGHRHHRLHRFDRDISHRGTPE
jgi:hypothetical protein